MTKHYYNIKLDIPQDADSAKYFISEGYTGRLEDGVLIIEPEKSKDERIRKAIDEIMKLIKAWKIAGKYGLTAGDIRRWLEKQKENTEKEYVFRPLGGTDITIAAEQAIRRVNEGDCLVFAFNGMYVPVRYNSSVKELVDEYEAYLKKQKEQTEELSTRLNGLMQEYVKSGEDEEEQEHRLKCYQLFWDALEDSEFFKQKEQKPILEVFGFKVGDAVRLKDGDGRKHIIKSFKEVEGVHGPNFYNVEFEDDSVRDGIYPGEKYPNGYFTQMEKFEEEQKPAEWGKNDTVFLKEIIDFFENKTVKLQHDIDMYAHWLKSLPERFNLQPKQEWSKEDELMRTAVIQTLETFKGRGTTGMQIAWLKSLRPQPYKEVYQAAKHDLAIKFMNYLDENRPEGKMGLSNGECEDIDKAFKENDWVKILRYAEKYGK